MAGSEDTVDQQRVEMWKEGREGLQGGAATPTLCWAKLGITLYD